MIIRGWYGERVGWWLRVLCWMCGLNTFIDSTMRGDWNDRLSRPWWRTPYILPDRIMPYILVTLGLFILGHVLLSFINVRLPFVLLFAILLHSISIASLIPNICWLLTNILQSITLLMWRLIMYFLLLKVVRFMNLLQNPFILVLNLLDLFL